MRSDYASLKSRQFHFAKCLHGLAIPAFLLLVVGAAPGFAQTFPSRPLSFVVPYPPGGGTDIVARLLAQKMSESMGQPVVVENKPGASGQIGTNLVARAAPDGYSMVIGGTPLGINPSLYRNIPFDVLTDLTPLSLLVTQPLVLVVHPSLPAQSVRELIALAKAQPGRINYASASSGSGGHLATELFKSMAGVDLVHVPYKGTAPSVTAILANEVGVLFDNPGTSLPHIQAGKLRPLAVTTRVRSPQLPSVPTLQEAGVDGYEVVSWFGVMGPGRLPKGLADRLSGELAKAMQMPDVREKLLQMGFMIIGNTPEQFGAFLRAEVAQWKRVVEVSGAKAD
jgi:tripartite-type tricarboxylate transporter receptor subunit TctC